MSLFWIILLMLMLTYVVSSMVGVPLSLETSFILGIAGTIIIYIIPFILSSPSEKDGVH